MKVDYHPNTTPGEVWDKLAAENAVSAICYHHSPELFEVKGKVEASYFRELVASYMTVGEATVLDIGGGIGRIARYLAPEVKEYVLLDVSGEMLRQAEERLRGEAAFDKLRFVKGNGTDLGEIPEGTIDFALSYLTFQHCDREVTVHYLRELARVLKPEGRAWIQVPPMAYPERFEDADRRDWPVNLRRWYPGEFLEVCLRCGLSVLAADCVGIEVLVRRTRRVAWRKDAK